MGRNFQFFSIRYITDQRLSFLYPTRQAIQRNIEASACNHFCSRKAIRITYSDCVTVALGIQHVEPMHRILICGSSGCTEFFHIIS